MELTQERAPEETITDPGPGGNAPPPPPPPDSLEEAGLTEEFVAGLVVKALHHRGAAVGFELSDMLALPFSVLDEVIQQLQERRFLEVHSTKGPRRGEYVFRLTSAGRKRATEELEMCRYVGPAPVPFEEFRRWVEIQTIERARITERELRNALDDVVLRESMLELLGPAINSGRSLFLYGESGNGKTLLAERIARAFGERYYVPHSVLVGSSVMIVHDPVHHGPGAGVADGVERSRPQTEPPSGAGPDSRQDPGPETEAGPSNDLPEEASPAFEAGAMLREIVRSIPEHDRRYVEATRPVVVTGGELTLEQLDLQWDPTGRMYQAPPQLKAAGGVLVVDDLGRQRVPVRDLLNRWVVPLEHRRDYLTLRSGRKIVVPFDCFVIFSTNLDPRSLADEAFLRRIHYKIEVLDPGREEYESIFRSCCEERGIPFEEEALGYLFDTYYGDGHVQPRGCHPRDVLNHLRDLAEYRGQPARLRPDLLEQACRSYFLPSARAGASGLLTE
ncbi:MAG: ATP-binding protein [Longimicrobiales bacterium]